MGRMRNRIFRAHTMHVTVIKFVHSRIDKVAQARPNNSCTAKPFMWGQSVATKEVVMVSTQPRSPCVVSRADLVWLSRPSMKNGRV